MFKFSMFAVLVLVTLQLSAQQTKIGVQKGQKFLVETANKLNSYSTVMGQTMETTFDSKYSTQYEIMKTDDTSVDFQSSYTKMQLNASMMGQSINFDSDKKDNEGPTADLLTKLMNKPNPIIIDKKGNIIKMDVPEEAMQAANLGIGGGGNEVITELFIPVLIGNELKPGDSFSDINNIKKEKYQSQDSGIYRISAVENGIASISYTGTQVVVMVMEQMGMEMINRGNNLIKSQLQVDTITGMVLSKTSEVESTINIDVAGMTIPATAKVFTTTKISPVH